MDKYEVGDVVRLKKQHPCGSSEWEILRVGADFRLKCTGCGHQIMIARKLSRKKIQKKIRKKSLKSCKIRAIVDARDILLFLAHSLKEWARDQKEENSHE